MRKFLLYLLLFPYTLLLIKPAMPSVMDVLAHTFWYTQHMATVHYEHGKYHVHYDYLQAERKDYPGRNTGLPKTENTANEHLVRPGFSVCSLSPILPVYFDYPSHHLSKTFLKKDYPPPKA